MQSRHHEGLRIDWPSRFSEPFLSAWYAATQTTPKAVADATILVTAAGLARGAIGQSTKHNAGPYPCFEGSHSYLGLASSFVFCWSISISETPASYAVLSD